MFKKNLKYKNPNVYLIKKKNFIRDWENLYANIKNPWNQNENFSNDESVIILKSLINKFSKNKKKIRLLDVGAGSGSLKKIINKKILYTGTDIHKKKNKNVIYDNITVFNNKFKNKFDFLICLKTIYYVGDKIYAVLKNLKSYLKKNGFLVISYNLKKNSFSNKYLNDIKLRYLLTKNFKEIYTIEINRQLYEKNSKYEKITLFIFQK